MDELSYVPRLPQEIKESALDGKLIIFVGNGVSRLLGYPSWEGLSNSVLKRLAQEGKTDYGVIQGLIGLEPKKKLSIAELIASEAHYRIPWEDFLQPGGSSSMIYSSYLNKLGCAFVTTNYDDMLSPIINSKDNATTQVNVNRIFRPEEFLSNRLGEPCTVFYLHGCLKEDPNHLVVTTRQYLERYDIPSIGVFLDEMFKYHTILFIGYGLEETEILEHILRRGNARGEDERRRFMLQGFYQYQNGLYKLLSEYYRYSFGVHLCGYILDKMEHLQLENVMQDWTPQLDIRPPSSVDDLQYIKEVLSEQA